MSMDDLLRDVLMSDSRIAFALLFGSTARGTPTPFSDVDVAIGLQPGARFEVADIGELTARLERAVGATVDLVLLDEVPSPVAYRAFRDGRMLFEANRSARVASQARAILEYLDFKPVEELFTQSVLRAARRG